MLILYINNTLTKFLCLLGILLPLAHFVRLEVRLRLLRPKNAQLRVVARQNPVDRRAIPAPRACSVIGYTLSWHPRRGLWRVQSKWYLQITFALYVVCLKEIAH